MIKCRRFSHYADWSPAKWLAFGRFTATTSSPRFVEGHRSSISHYFISSCLLATAKIFASRIDLFWWSENRGGTIYLTKLLWLSMNCWARGEDDRSHLRLRAIIRLNDVIFCLPTCGIELTFNSLDRFLVHVKFPSFSHFMTPDKPIHHLS